MVSPFLMSATASAALRTRRGADLAAGEAGAPRADDDDDEVDVIPSATMQSLSTRCERSTARRRALVLSIVVKK